MSDSKPDATPDSNGADARLRFALSKDGLKLGISRYFPPSGKGKELTVEAIREQLRAAGVDKEPEPGACERIILYLNEGKDITKKVLVRGEPAQEPRDATLAPEGDLNFPVFAGQVCARMTPAVTAAEGLTIDGRVLRPKETHAPKNLDARAGEHCSLDMVSGAFTAQVYGLASITDNEVSVNPLLRLTKDKAYLRAGIHWRDNLERPTGPELFAPELGRLGVTLKVDEKALAEAVAQALETGALVENVILVRGKRPTHGRDGWLEFKVAMPQEAGTVDEHGRMDWRDRGGHSSVKPGDTIALLHPPEPGQGGIDIFGKPIPAIEGKPLSVLTGENVEVVNENTFKATATGMVIHERKVLSVTDCLQVNDVDVASGNIKVASGSVKINGSVQSGSKVSAPNHVVVGDTVENARIKAGGDVEVKNGILMSEGDDAEADGRILAGGSVMAGFAAGARIKAGKDVLFSGEVINCRIETKGMVATPSGKGILHGGEIITHKGLEVHELGSDLGVTTTVVIPWQGDENLPLLEKKSEIVKQLKELNEKLGPGEDEDILLSAKTDQQHIIGGMLEQRMRLKRGYKAIAHSIAKYTAKRREEIQKARVRVHGVIHPGVVFKIAGRGMQVTKPISRSQVYFDPDVGEIVVKSL